MINWVNRLVNGLFTALVALAPRVVSRARPHCCARPMTHRDGPPRQSHYVGPSEWKVVHNALVTGL
jgi:hypothetical protein